MKWYFACNSFSKEYIPLIKAAVESALKNTSLEPNFIYDGSEDELTQWLENKGVKVIYHKSSLYPELEKEYSGNELKIASGAYLRCDIPLIEKDEKYVLYTDCDVIFLKDIEMKTPKYFSCSSESNKTDFKCFNTGIMFMNVENLRKTHAAFSKFITKNFKKLVTWDQTAYQLYYKGKNERLDVIYNHKPYWGISENAKILHFHGPKPTMFFQQDLLKIMDSHQVLLFLYKMNPASYDYYLKLFKEYYPQAEYDYYAIEKLNKNDYPMAPQPKNCLIIRIKNFIRKLIVH